MLDFNKYRSLVKDFEKFAQTIPRLAISAARLEASGILSGDSKRALLTPEEIESALKYKGFKDDGKVRSRDKGNFSKPKNS